MWLNLSENAATWQEALLPHLKGAERWLRSQLRSQPDVEEAVQEALAALCLNASRCWQPHLGLRAALRHLVAHVRQGQSVAGFGQGWGARRRRTRLWQSHKGWEATLRGRELSPVQGAQWNELRESLPPLLSVAAERIGTGQSIRATAKEVGVQHDTLTRHLRISLARFR